MSETTQSDEESAGSTPAASTENNADPGEETGVPGSAGAGESADLPERVPPESGGVYAVMGVPGWIKIGRAKNIAQRMRDLQVGHPVPLRLVAVLSRDQLFETVLHARFRHLRGCGEWFRFTDELRRAIEGDDPLFARNREEAARAVRQLRRLRFIARARERGDEIPEPPPAEPYRPKRRRRSKSRAPSNAPSLGDIRAWLAARRAPDPAPSARSTAGGGS